MTLKSSNVWVIYQIKTLEHSMLPFVLILESLNEIWANLIICPNGVIIDYIPQYLEAAQKILIYALYFQLSLFSEFGNVIKHSISCLKYFLPTMPCFNFDNRLLRQSKEINHNFFIKPGEEKWKRWTRQTYNSSVI